MGEHQLTIRDYLRHSNLNVTNQYLQTSRPETTVGLRPASSACGMYLRLVVG